MKLTRRRSIILLVTMILAIISISYIIYVKTITEREVAGRMGKNIPPIPTKRLAVTARASAEKGIITYPYAADIMDAVAIEGGYLAATGCGLVLGNESRAVVFHHGGGLPVFNARTLARVGGQIHILAPEGLMILRGAPNVNSSALDLELFTPLEGPELIDLATDGNAEVILDASGRVMQFFDKQFHLVAQLSRDPAAHVGLLGGRPVVASSTNGIRMITGAGAGAEIKNIGRTDEVSDAVLTLVGSEADILVGSTGSLIRATGSGSEHLLNGFAVSALAREGENVFVGGLEGSVRTLNGQEIGSFSSVVHRLRLEQNRLLISTGEGLWVWESGVTARLAMPLAALQPIGDPYLTALASTLGGELLIGGLNRGLYRLPANAPAAVAAGLQKFGINAILADGAGWLVATTNGLARLDSSLAVNQWWSTDQGLPSRVVTSVIKAGNAVMTATGAGIARITPTAVQAINAFHGLAGNNIYCLVSDGHRLAAGGLAGLNLLGGSDFLTVTQTYSAAAGGLPHNWVQAIIADENRLVVGTYGGGIAVIEGNGPARPVAVTAGLSINPQAAARWRGYWLFGTLTKGLAASRDLEHWVFVDAQLPSRNVTALAAAPEALWVGTDRGLAQLSPEAIERAVSE